MPLITSWSTDIAELKPKERTTRNALLALQNNPRVSCFEMSEKYKWLPPLIDDLKHLEYIKAVKSEYPWLKYEIRTKGRIFLDTQAKP